MWIIAAVWLIVIYLLICWVQHPIIPAPTGREAHTLTQVWGLSQGSTGRSLLTAGIGFGGVWVADLLGNGDPLWPGLALLAAVLGEVMPLFFKGASARIGFSYWGGLLYLDFGVGLICAGVVLVNWEISKDHLAARILLLILAPVLVHYAALNPVFFWITVAVGFVVIFKQKDEIFIRVTGQSKPGDGEGDQIKLR